jgi:ribonuclease-3
MKTTSELATLEAALGHVFRDRELLECALMHSSAREETGGKDNQVLEFLGDAVLDLAVSDLAILAHPELDEGALTRLRAALVNATSLAHLARDLGLGNWLRLGRGEERSGGRDKERLLAACYEALVGAVFRDGGYPVVHAMIARHFGSAVDSRQAVLDFKTALQEFTQERGLGTPVYRLLSEDGPAHARSFAVEVVLKGRSLANGEGSNRKEAEQAAAERALAEIESVDTDAKQGSR